ncbi:MAG: hypothetical protein SRB2_02694 [Desulfobacteraceae bacterium Eth-SRB2]|nr:MAG: hypothetical protein SRB2_02694 [Desulfobacteraceae bacterium Eth-SRB2]
MFTFKKYCGSKSLDEVIGQERAVRSHKLRPEHVRKSGLQHFFVTGLEGTGKSTIIRDLVDKQAKTASVTRGLVHGQQF